MTSARPGRYYLEHQFTGTTESNPRPSCRLQILQVMACRRWWWNTRSHDKPFQREFQRFSDLLWESEVEYAKGIACLDDINDDDAPDIVAGTAGEIGRLH